MGGSPPQGGVPKRLPLFDTKNGEKLLDQIDGLNLGKEPHGAVVPSLVHSNLALQGE